MNNYNANRDKVPDVTAAQTPSKRPHRAPFHKLTVRSAQLTTANQSTPTGETPGQGGGQRVSV